MGQIPMPVHSHRDCYMVMVDTFIILNVLIAVINFKININMGFFSQDTEADAFKQVEKVNSGMRAINAIIHSSGGHIGYGNRTAIRPHFNQVVNNVRKYERIKNNLSEIDRMMMLGATVNVWNGERVGLLTWEQYVRNVIHQLKMDLNL